MAEAILHQAECISALLFGLAGRSTENEVGVSNKRRRVELDAAEEVKEEAKKTFDDDDLVPHLLLGTDYTMANGVPPTFSLCLFTPISQGTMQYPEELLRNAWQDVLLCQFHDVLPGSCIPEVRKDAEDYLSRVRSGVGVLVGEGCKSLGECIMRGWQASAPTSATASSGLDATITPYFVWNGTDADRTEVVLLRDEPEPADVDSIQVLLRLHRCAAFPRSLTCACVYFHFACFCTAGSPCPLKVGCAKCLYLVMATESFDERPSQRPRKS